MRSIAEIALRFESALGMDYHIVGHHYQDSKPDKSIGFKKNNGGCLISMIYASAKGQIVAIDKESAGWNCSGYYLGYRDKIFDGIDLFLSHGPCELIGREPERFIKTPELAKEWVDSMRSTHLETRTGVFMPMNQYTDDIRPEIVVMLLKPDQISAMVFLAHYDNPMHKDIISTGFMSSCVACVTQPLKDAREGLQKITWGHHDPAARSRLPKELMSLAMPVYMLEKMDEYLDETFIRTHIWHDLRKRNASE